MANVKSANSLLAVVAVALGFGWILPYLQTPTQISSTSVAQKLASGSGGESACDPKVCTASELIEQHFPGGDSQKIDQIRHMFMCVPDPIEASTGHYFDPSIDVVKRSLAVHDFTLIRYCLPWTSTDRTANEWQKRPGVLVFHRRRRNLDDEPKGPGIKTSELLVVYLVGETPTAGIHAGAFDAAANQIRAFNRDPCKEAAAVRAMLLGPFFSGSSDSLVRAVVRAQQCTPAVAFRICSGTATHLDRKYFNASNVVINTTLHRTDDITDALQQFVLTREGFDVEALRAQEKSGTLTEEKRPDIKIAWVSESDTVFGRNMFSGSLVRLVNFHYPMHISRVREAEGDLLAALAKGQIRLTTHRTLDVPFDREYPATDSMPELHPEMASANAELMLRQMFRAIRQQQFRYIGIVASDARDTLLLTRLAKEQLPNAQIMVVSPELLYTHPQFYSALNGVLVGGSYPLNSQAQRWVAPFKESFTMASNEGDLGVYNAVQWLLFREKGVDNPEYACFGEVFQTPCDSQQPQRWISVVSRDGIIPIEVQPPRSQKRCGNARQGLGAWTMSSMKSDADGKTALPPIIKFDTDSYLFLFVVLGAATVGLYVLFVAKVSPELIWPECMGKWFKTSQGVTLMTATRLSLASWVMGIVLTVMLVASSWSICILGNGHLLTKHEAWKTYGVFGVERVAGTGIVFVSIVFGAVCALLLAETIAGYLLHGRSGVISSRKSSIGRSVLILVGLYCAYLLLMGQASIEPNTLLWASRVADPLSRVTPVMPCILLTLGLACLSYSWVKSIVNLNDEYAVSGWHTIANWKLMDEKTPIQLAKHSERMSECNDEQRDGSRPFVLGAIIFLWIPYMYFFRSVPGIDHPWINFLLWTLIAFFSMHWLWAFMVTNQLRSQYRKVLQCLATSPVRDAFDKKNLPMECGSYVGRSLFDMRRPSNRQHSIAMRALDVKGSCSEEMLQEISREIWENPSVRSHPKSREFLAVRALSYVAQWGAVLKWRILALFASAILFVLAVNAYPIQPKGMLVSTGLWMLVAVSILFLLTNWQTETSELLSRVTGTDPHQVTPDLRFFLESFAALIPVAILLIGNTFPSIWNWAATVIEPALNTIR